MEIFDIVDEQGLPTGETVEREIAHARGIRHRTAHVWLLRKKAGRLQILLQKRSEDKDSFPGCYDISSAGHIPAGVDFIPSALRELQEELGVTARAEDLHYCGTRHIHYEEVFHEKPFVDEQVSRVFALWMDKEPADFTLQEEEVTEVRWFDFAECKTAVARGTLPNCIEMEELDMLEEYALSASI